MSESETQKLFEDPEYRSKWESIELDDPEKYMTGMKRPEDKLYIKNLLNLNSTLDVIQTHNSSRRGDVGAVSDTSFAGAGLYRTGSSYWDPTVQGISWGGIWRKAGDLKSEEMWKMLPEIDGKKPGGPLPLMAWPRWDLEIRLEFLVCHVMCADERGVIGPIDQFLRSLQPDEWVSRS